MCDPDGLLHPLDPEVVTATGEEDPRECWDGTPIPVGSIIVTLPPPPPMAR